MRPMTDDVLIRVEHLYRYYGDLCAVQDLSFEVKRGEVVGFLGPNGAGKTTAMQVITGNLAPSAGRVSVNGFDILDDPKQAKVGLGYLPEQPPLYRELTVDEYLHFCARLNRIPKPQVPAAMARAKERCGLEEAGARLIGNLSKGFQQRVGIAQAIVHTPAVVVLDEPTVGLDPIQIREIRTLIRDLGKEHSVLLSSHILPEVQATCDRVQIIHRGVLAFSDSIAGLERQMRASALLAAMRSPPPVGELRAIAGVQGVEAAGEGRFRLHHAPDEDPAETLVHLSVECGWRLYELVPERRSLEEVFMEITQAEPSLAEAA
jgi:ABC-2 type transport system ATP-binding protein